MMPGPCPVELDSSTDIFKAKEILGGHICIKGDVPAPLMAPGRPDEVTEYCRKVIERVGKGGGLVLSTGYARPVDAKFENVKALIEAAKTISVPA
jgi:uroporphyrinogen-III decarboxylase